MKPGFGQHSCVCSSHQHMSSNNHALASFYVIISSTLFSYQIPDGEHAVELVGHGVVLHGHEQSVEDDAHSDGQV